MSRRASSTAATNLETEANLQTRDGRTLKTSRSRVDPLLDLDNMSVQLNTLQRAAGIVGQRLVIGLEPVAKLSSSPPLGVGSTCP
jgi:hypothetical protein